ncbi:putative cationic amino acid transporter [Schistosoma mansoni]|uniref:putative cationic amino acid transporter n=1 Tax=Schistosoma mansoni TaxID=6183 RepID=UPI00022DC6EC|nr:putative cationic amino acid transporter [Schistosoma mansoni]|eukprot:XP_018651825.1 putative cationic amino acid transporter [Schistosoma mansoni]
MCKYFLAYYVLCFAISVSPLLSKESTKYNLFIEERAVLDKLNDAGVNVFSKSGQKFSCSWGTDSGAEPNNATSQLSSSVVHSLLSMFSGFDCLRVKKGWWTYEFCFRKYVVQYHDESKETSKTLLGIFESEFDWDNSTEKPKYHSQFYSNGSICDLTNMPRLAEVQFVCTDSRTFHILSVEEPESCIYLLKISTPSLCGNSHFAAQFSTKPHDITCHPTLSGPDYYRYDALNKARNPVLQSSVANMSHTLSLPSKRLFTYKNMYNKIRNNRRRRKSKSLKRSTGKFLRSLKRLSTLYKKQNLKSSWSFHPVSLFPTKATGLYKLWIHIGSLTNDLSNFTSVLLRRNENPNEAHTMLSTVIRAYKKHNLDIPTVEDIPFTRLPTEWRNNAKSAYLKYKLDFAFSSNKDNNNIEISQYNEKVLDDPLSYEEYSKLFGVIKNLLDFTDLFLETSNLYVKILFFLHKKIELSQNIETRLKQTFSNILTDSNVNFVVIQGGNRIMKDKYNQVASDQWDRNLLPSLKQRDIIDIMQKVVADLNPEISDEVDIVEKPGNQGGLSAYYIMPGGHRKKEEKRVRKLEQNYHFTFH